MADPKKQDKLIVTIFLTELDKNIIQRIQSWAM